MKINIFKVKITYAQKLAQDIEEKHSFEHILY